jgi:hypothetical protein
VRTSTIEEILMSPFLHYDIARQVNDTRLREGQSVRDVRRARRARRRARAPVAIVVPFPQREPGTWVIERQAS